MLVSTAPSMMLGMGNVTGSLFQRAMDNTLLSEEEEAAEKRAAGGVSSLDEDDAGVRPLTLDLPVSPLIHPTAPQRGFESGSVGAAPTRVQPGSASLSQWRLALGRLHFPFAGALVGAAGALLEASGGFHS